FSPDGQYIASACDDGVRLWKTQDWTCIAVFTEHDSPVTALAFLSNGEILCSGGRNGTVRHRRMREILRHYKPRRSRDVGESISEVMNREDLCSS
ncbi:WD40-repeat-containing domain protein, partial [Cerioporus squamosus]